MARIKDETVLMARVLKMLPGSIPKDAVVAVECDWDSYWVYLRTGYNAPGTACHTIHEDTLKALRREVRGIYTVQNDMGGYEG